MQQASILDWIDGQQEAMLARTKRWAAINSGSYHLAGLEKMRTALAEEFSVLGGAAEHLPLESLMRVTSEGEREAVPVGQALRIRKRPQAPVQILFAGHMDTVFGKEHPFQTVSQLDGETLNGPGVADLKGGLSVMLTTLEALERSDYAETIGWEVLINPDEEIGSLGSSPLLKEAAQCNAIGLIYEPAFADGTLAGRRKGSGNFTIVAHGKSAHAGREPEKGRNAIAALADYIQRLFALNGKMPGVTVNPGLVDGGRALNVVPDIALCRFNIRVGSHEEQEWVEAQLASLQQALSVMDGIRFELHGGFGRPPKILSAENERLFALVAECGASLGQKIGWQPTGGCCDGNNLAAYGLPNVDTMGVRGGGLHSDQEFMKISSLREKAKLGALTVMKIASGEVPMFGRGAVN